MRLSSIHSEFDIPKRLVFPRPPDEFVDETWDVMEVALGKNIIILMVVSETGVCIGAMNIIRGIGNRKMLDNQIYVMYMANLTLGHPPILPLDHMAYVSAKVRPVGAETHDEWLAVRKRYDQTCPNQSFPHATTITSWE